MNEYQTAVAIAALGAVLREWWAVRKPVMKGQGSFRYYLENNWFTVVGNTIGVVMLIMMLPALVEYLGYDPRIIGGVIGLMGPVLIRAGQDHVKGMIKSRKAGKDA